AVRSEARHWRGGAEAVLSQVLVWKTALPNVRLPFAVRQLLLAPHIGLLVGASSRGKFPFGFGGKPFARPLAVFQRIVITDVNNWMLFTTCDGGVRSFRMPTIQHCHVGTPG